VNLVLRLQRGFYIEVIVASRTSQVAGAELDASVEPPDFVPRGAARSNKIQLWREQPRESRRSLRAKRGVHIGTEQMPVAGAHVVTSAPSRGTPVRPASSRVTGLCESSLIRRMFCRHVVGRRVCPSWELLEQVSLKRNPPRTSSIRALTVQETTEEIIRCHQI
jgi:hypothetical protein